MNGAHGTKQDPRYTLKDGTELKLRPIKALLLDRWRIDHKKKYPPPKPPQIILENGDPWLDANDPWYKKLTEEYDEQMNSDLAEFLFNTGVRDNPPDEWQPIFHEDDVPVRYMWLSEILDNEDVSGLMNAIMGVDSPTPEGVEEAEKKLTPDGEASP